MSIQHEIANGYCVVCYEPEGSTEECKFCICVEYDGRGWSCCNVACAQHPPSGNCPGCGDFTYDDQKCFTCAYLDGECF